MNKIQYYYLLLFLLFTNITILDASSIRSKKKPSKTIKKSNKSKKITKSKPKPAAKNKKASKITNKNGSKIRANPAPIANSKKTENTIIPIGFENILNKIAVDKNEILKLEKNSKSKKSKINDLKNNIKILEEAAEESLFKEINNINDKDELNKKMESYSKLIKKVYTDPKDYLTKLETLITNRKDRTCKN